MKRNDRLFPRSSAGRQRLEALVAGPDLLNDPMLNRDTFWQSEEINVFKGSADELLSSHVWRNR
jgi:hypothetical protein